MQVLSRSSSVSSGGSGYAINDTGVIDQGGNTSAGYVVLQTGAGGAVTAIFISPSGNGLYTLGSGIPTAATSAAGSGLTVDITSLVTGCDLTHGPIYQISSAGGGSGYAVGDVLIVDQFG